MKNQPCYDIEGNPIGWLSRSACVVTLIVAKVKGKYYVLASQRGKGTPDPEFVGSWNLCCGYLDYDETLRHAAARELFEETGVIVKPDNLVFYKINDDPFGDKRQNITFRYFYLLKRDYLPTTTNSYSETDEVEKIEWIPIEKINNFKWAFNHKELVNEMLDYYIFKNNLSLWQRISTKVKNMISKLVKKVVSSL